MSQITITLITMAVVVVLMILDIFPVSVSMLFGLAAMVMLGILTPAQAFSGFSATATIMVAGMLIIGEAMYSSGLSNSIEKVLYKVSMFPKKWFIFFVYIISAVLSIFINGVAILAFMFPVLNSISMPGENRIDKKSTYFASAVGTVTGGCCSLVGASSVLNGASIFAASEGGRMLKFFEPGVLGLPFVIVGALIYLTFGCRLQDKVFDYEEKVISIQDDSEYLAETNNKKNTVLTLIVFVTCVVLWIGNWFNMAIVSMIGAAVLMACGCCRSEKAYSRISWETVIVLGASVGLAAAVDVSGTGAAIADWFFKMFAGLSDSPFGMCALVLVISTIISNFMSNNSAVVIMAPIAIAIAQKLGVSGVPFIIAVVTGSNLSVSTPLSVATVTMSMVAGYKAKHLLKVGGVFNLAGIIVCILAMKLIYFM